MKYVIVCVRDVCADLFGQPMFQASVGMAQRSFSDAVNRQEANNIIAQHPEHFELFLLGSFDDQTAEFDLLSKPKQLLLGSNCVTKPS